MLTCLLLCIGGNLWAQEVFVKVTSLDELQNNDEVIMVNKDKQYAMSTEQKTNTRAVVEIDVKDDVILLQDNNTNVQVLKLKTTTIKQTKLYAFYTGRGFLYPSANTYLLTNTLGENTTLNDENKSILWKFTKINSNGQIQIQNYNTTQHYLQYYGGSTGSSIESKFFACRTGSDCLIYKKVPSSKSTRDTNNTLGTICLSQNAIINCTAYSVAGKVSNEEKVILKEEGNVLEAGVPYIFYSANKHLEAIQYGTPVESPKTKNNGLIGTFTSVTIPEKTTNYCILTQNKLAHCGTGCTVGANRAYFDLSQMTKYTPSGAKPRFILTQDGVVDAIEALPSSSGSPAIYSITGTKTTQMTKGINIVKHADGTVTKVLKR